MIDRWICIFLLMSLAAVYGCDGILYNRDPLYQKLLDMELNQTTRVDSLIDGEWEYVCLLPPYYGDVFLLEDKVQYKKISDYIYKNNIPTEEGYWHLVFSSSENLNFITFNIKEKLDVKQRNFNKELLRKFTTKKFFPNSCVFFHEAVFLKFREKYQFNRKVHSRVYLTLGEWKND